MVESQNHFKDPLTDVSFFTSLGFDTINTAIVSAIREIQEAYEGKREVYPTGFKKLDYQLLGGFTPGKLYVIGGRPGVGKSLFSNDLLFSTLDHAKRAKRKVLVLYFTFEMFPSEQLIRIISKDTKKSLRQLYSLESRLDSSQMSQIIAATDKYEDYPIFFMPTGLTTKQIIQKILEVQKRYPDYRIVNLIDHSRLVINDKNESHELQKLVGLSQGLVYIQKRTKCISILLSQLNRNIEKPERRSTSFQPMLSDLFGSDSIGQEAHVVMLLNRPHALYNIKGDYCGHDTENLLAVHVEKNRNGELGMVPFELSPATFTLIERTAVQNTNEKS